MGKVFNISKGNLIIEKKCKEPKQQQQNRYAYHER